MKNLRHAILSLERYSYQNSTKITDEVLCKQKKVIMQKTATVFSSGSRSTSTTHKSHFNKSHACLH